MNSLTPIAFFVTPHGFGHAARASAVMNAIYARWPYVHFEIYTQVPQWFFENALSSPFSYHLAHTDVGLVQQSSLHFDLEKTLAALEMFLPFKEDRLDVIAHELEIANVQLMISDISPLGIAVAEYAGICSVLIENFTWDWIYAPYLHQDIRFRKFIRIFEKIYSSSGQRIQAAPVCAPVSDAVCTPPISRRPRTASDAIRKKLGIGNTDKMVLITMGGFPENLPFADQLSGLEKNIRFVLPGTETRPKNDTVASHNVVYLPKNTTYHHPDLVNAADLVVGKLGYSTLAEIYHAGVPYGFIPRKNFRESPVFESYVRETMIGQKIREKDFINGIWLQQLPEMLAMGRRVEALPNGAETAAEYICNYLKRNRGKSGQGCFQ